MSVRAWILFALPFALLACDDAAPNTAAVDGADDTFLVGGKADNGFEGCALDNVLRWVNGDVTVEGMKAAGVHTRAAKKIVEFRAGADEVMGTGDDQRVLDLPTLDTIRYVGRVALQQLVSAAGTECPKSAVVFSPQAHEDSHLARIIDEMDRTERSIDVAMYSFRDGATIDALKRAIDRGVTVRLMFEGANGDHRDPEGSASASFEAMGVDVRYINKIMHHKFALFDGPQNHRDEAATARLATGSGNWSSSAATKYDENTVYLADHPEAALRFQREFNLLWENSRSFESTDTDPELKYFATVAISDEDIAAMGDDPAFDVALTSTNFETWDSDRYGPTFSAVRGRNTVADRVVALIEGARTSVHVASGHLRSRPISEALMKAAERDPNLEIKVYLDNQEYVSGWSHDNQVTELEECLVGAADSEARTEDCMNRGFRFGYAVARAGVDVRYKYYHYKWDVRNAAQMHHKYLIVDGETLATGSYNFSDNAEHNTIENMVIYRAAAFPELVAAYEANFQRIWVTGEAEGLLGGLFGGLLEEIVSGTDDVPLHFAPMALDWNQVTELKAAIRDACPDVNDIPTGVRTCAR